MEPLLRLFDGVGGTGLDAARMGAAGLEPGFFGTVAMVFFPDGLG